MAVSSMTSFRRSEQYSAWLLAAPAVLLLATFIIAPFVMSIGFSFTNQRLISPLPTRFTGLQNFQRLLADPIFWRSLGNNFYFTVVVVPVQTSLALLLAILVDRAGKSSNFFRMLYFMPVVVPMVVVSVIWYFMYNPSIGLINRFLETVSFGVISDVRWLESRILALPAIMILSIWQGVGFQMVIYLAGLQGIPHELYEAARVDGASPLRQFWSVTVPQLRNTTIFIVVSTTILAFQLFVQIDIMTKGGPNNATITTVYYMYREGFRNLRIGYASATSVVFVLIVVSITILQRRYLQSEREVT